MSDLFNVPRGRRRESKLGLDRIRSTVTRIERKLAAGEASTKELERIASLRRRLARGEEEARVAWQKAFGQWK